MVTPMSKKKRMKTSLSLDELQEIARQRTVEALEGYVIPDELRSQLVLGVFFEGEYRVFELYLPGERPSDARVIARARLSTKDGTGTVDIIGLQPIDRAPST
jgi:hypothetical protein